jgi:hypothetical protein
MRNKRRESHRRSDRRSDFVRRLLAAREIVMAEFTQRQGLTNAEAEELKDVIGGWAWERLKSLRRPASLVFAAELANTDRQLAARAIGRGIVTRDELQALHRLLKFQPRAKRSDKLDELIRIVERQLEATEHGNSH